MSARWVCKLCPQHGLGGPVGWERHYRAAHSDGNHYGAQLSFGFAPNYSNGRRTSHWHDYRPAPRMRGET